MMSDTALSATSTLPPLHRLEPTALATELGEALGSHVEAEPLRDPRLLHVNETLCASLGLDDAPQAGTALRDIAAGASPAPHGLFATVYAGHQFGVWVPQLGDGRAALIGALRDRDGLLQEIQPKGCGRTPYSRFADGRAVLRSSIREYLASEALHGLGIPTTRALALIASDTPVQRERFEHAAVVLRVAPSFLRFGHFEYLARSGGHDMLRRLVEHTIAQHFPHLRGHDDPIVAWASDVVTRTAELVAQWQAAGFCHGVMNTDNMSVLGLTIDYGPYGFIDGFDSSHICNHSDEGGRYAYDRQPTIAQWNCARFLEALLPVLDADSDRALARANDVLAVFADRFRPATLAAWRRKLGLERTEDDDGELINALLQWMQGCRADFTATFRALCDVPADEQAPLPAWLRDQVTDPAGFDDWVKRYRSRLQRERRDDASRRMAMRNANPSFVVRNHIAQHIIDAAEAGDPVPLQRMMELVHRPYDDHPGMDDLTSPPPAGASTPPVSCSS